MMKEFMQKIGSSTAFTIFFIIWVPLVACGVQGLVDHANDWVAYQHGNEWYWFDVNNLKSAVQYGTSRPSGFITAKTLQVWMRCLQTSWAFLGFMLSTVVIQWILSAHFSRKIENTLNHFSWTHNKEKENQNTNN